MKTKNMVCGIFAVLLALAFTACLEPDIDVPVTGVTLSKTTLSLSVGVTETLTATVAPENATNNAVTWSSSNTAVATVSNNGDVTGVSAGTAVITVTTEDGGKTANCSVNVTGGSGSSGITYEVTQVGGVDGTTDTNAIEFTFNASVDNLTEDNITVTNGSGSVAVNTGSLSGSGTYWALNITVTNAGSIYISINKSGIEAETKNVTVFKEGQITSTLSSITLDIDLVNTTYNQGETLNLAGLVVTAAYSNGYTGEVTGYTSDPEDGATLSTTGTITVTISYTEETNTQTATFNIMVTGGTDPDPGTGGSLTVSSLPNGNWGAVIYASGTNVSYQTVSSNMDASGMLEADGVFAITGLSGSTEWTQSGSFPVVLMKTNGASVEGSDFDISNPKYRLATVNFSSGIGTVNFNDFNPLIRENLTINNLPSYTSSYVPYTVYIFNENVSLPQSISIPYLATDSLANGSSALALDGAYYQFIIGLFSGSGNYKVVLSDMRSPTNIKYLVATVSFTNGDAVADYSDFEDTHTHQWGTWTQKTAPTETTDGEEERVCSIDNLHKETRTAYATGTEGLSFELIDSDTKYRVSKGTVSSDTVYIPVYHLNNDTYEYLPITEIDSRAFENYTSLTSITIPATVTTIHGNAFSGCANLSIVTFAEGSRLESIGGQAFYRCTSLTSITIPASVTVIYANINYGPMGTGYRGAFDDCSNLRTVIFEESSQLQTIGEATFENCNNLTIITIPESVMSIGRYAFLGCTGLTSIEIPAGVTSIGSGVFTNWNSSQTINVLGHASEAAADSAWGIQWRQNANANIMYMGILSVKGVTLNRTTLELGMNEEQNLTATIDPANSTNQTVRWTSDDNNIATVDENGKVKGIGIGTATITVTTEDGNFSATCTVTIPTYTVTFNSGDGSPTPPDQTDIAKGTTVNEPDAPTRDNYIFIGWYTSLQSTTAFDFSTPIISDMTLYAKYEWGEYLLGDIGPGGGIIFYKSQTGFTMTDTNEVCHYLEASPDNNVGGGQFDWGITIPVLGSTSSAIGTGRKNTALIVQAGGANYSVARYCTEYRGGGKDDWFLPSKDELNELYRNKHLFDNLPDYYYWSSTEGNTNEQGGVYIWGHNFTNGQQGQFLKSVTNNTRAIRAF